MSLDNKVEEKGFLGKAADVCWRDRSTAAKVAIGTGAGVYAVTGAGVVAAAAIGGGVAYGGRWLLNKLRGGDQKPY